MTVFPGKVHDDSDRPTPPTPAIGGHHLAGVPFKSAASRNVSIGLSGARPTTTESLHVDKGLAGASSSSFSLSQYFIGDAPALSKILSQTSVQSLWAPVHLIDAVLRATGQPCFVNNTFSGALIMLAMIVDPSARIEAAGCALLGGTTAVFAAAALMGMRGPPVTSGGIALNGILYGASFGPGQSLHRQPCIAAGIVGLSAISAWLARSLCALMASWPPYGLPALNAPFNILGTAYLLAATKWPSPSVIEVDPTVAASAAAATAAVPAAVNASTIDWSKLAVSVVLAPGPVYSCTSVVSSCIIYLAFLLFSPMLFTMSILGAVIGAALGAILCPADRMVEVYSGQWGYNPMLTCMAIGAFFFVFNIQSVMAAGVGAAISSLGQAGMSKLIENTPMPLLAWPFFMTTLFMLGAPTPSKAPVRSARKNSMEPSSAESDDDPAVGWLIRVPLDAVSTPEGNRREWKNKERSAVQERRGFLP